MDDKLKDKLSQEIIEENIELIPSLLNIDMIIFLNDGKAVDTRSVEFINGNGASFRFKELSSGTKQIINILSTVVLNMNKSSVFIFDEIEAGLHYELLDLAMRFFKVTSAKNKQLQFIVTSHQPTLLDYEHIANDNKVFLKVDADLKSPTIEYLSEYKLREYQKISHRYALDAFGTNPNTSSFYKLNEALDALDLKGDIT